MVYFCLRAFALTLRPAWNALPPWLIPLLSSGPYQVLSHPQPWLRSLSHCSLSLPCLVSLHSINLTLSYIFICLFIAYSHQNRCPTGLGECRILIGQDRVTLSSPGNEGGGHPSPTEGEWRGADPPLHQKKMEKSLKSGVHKWQEETDGGRDGEETPGDYYRGDQDQESGNARIKHGVNNQRKE